ncbi:uncharacterized protein LOC116268367 isoform X1 [Nymphaea colorata]|nr:uncharacterized protein LOC116247860 isoform X1 [Nymphaea colorata]XP_031505899.1 uncharacterized protein LOC116268367 isoform X1 [Nymphaea colorata]
MEHFINDSESNKMTPHKSDGVNSRESTHLSELPWLAHWKPSSTENGSQDISKLPTPSGRSKQTSVENLPQGPHCSKSGTCEADRPASKDDEQDIQKDEEEFVELRPSLLLPGECIVARSIKSKGMEKLCDLVGRGPKTTTLPPQPKLLLVNQSPAFKQPRDSDGQRKISTHGVSPLLFPSSTANFVFLDTQPPMLYKVLKGCQKTTDPGAASSASSPPHATDTSFGTIAACKTKTWPLAVRECSGQESNVSKACNGQFEDLEDQSSQVLKAKHESENYNMSDSKLDRYEFIESASVGPKHGKPEFKCNTSSLRPSICSKDGKSQCNFTETHSSHISCTHSALCKNKQCDCENKQCQHGCCFTFLDSGKRICTAATANEGNSGTEKKFTSPILGDFLFSRGEGKLKLNFSDMEFTAGKTSMPKDAKIAELPDTTVSNALPACSLHGLETVRVCTTVDKVEGVPGGPSKFSKTTHHFLITKKTDMAFSKEDRLIKRSSVDAKIDQNSFLRLFGVSPAFCPCDRKDTRMKLTSCRAARAGLLNEDTHGHCYRSSDIAAETSTIQQARASYLKSMNNNEVHTETSGFEASLGQTPSQLVSKDNFAWKRNAASVEEMACLVHCTAQASSVNVKHESSSETEPLDLNLVMSKGFGKGLALTAVNKDNVEAGTSCDPLERTTFPRKKPSKSNVSPSCSAMHACEDRKEMCASRTQSLDAEDLPAHADQPDPSQSDFSHPDQRPSSRWVKRLKRSHLEAFGTKRSVDGDISSHDKKIKLFSKVFNYGRSISKSELSTACIEKQQHQLVETVILPRHRRSAVDLMRESKDILSDPWIQRWRSAKGGGIQIGSAEVICEPECSKVSIIELQGKEFPSLGAMALMGKALTNFRPCEFRRMGPFVVWKTKSY